MKYSAIIPAGGSSTRYGNGNKLFQNLNGKPVFIHAVEQFRMFCEDRYIVIPVHKDHKSGLLSLMEQYLPHHQITVVEGGSDRTRSVLNAIEVLPRDCTLTAVHDAARPLICRETIKAVYEAAEQHSAAAAARRVTSTLKLADSEGLLSAGNIDREYMWEIETPQTFRTELLLHALRETVAQGLSFTDDTAAVECFCGIRTYPVQPDEINLKITRLSDLALAEALLNSR
ncbi:MAG: 2-C-methyl-D-erythritol 4-phosphate cytidylyltransferase [Lentisphaerae bacterium]|nr:2-C-methyl-D-erythritol 4-phosphate cytidylyltransferase [Lentisphaerota bacterium]